LAAYEESRQIGASYVGSDHVLVALAQDRETQAGELLERFAISHTKLCGAVIRGVESGEAAGRPDPQGHRPIATALPFWAGEPEGGYLQHAW
jgi:hypothetical protein